MGTGIQGYKDSYKVVGAQGCQGRCGGCTAHGTYWGKHRATQLEARTVALEMDFPEFLMFLGAPGPMPCLVLGASHSDKSCWL